MVWRNREGQDSEARFSDIEKTFGIQNLQDVEIVEDGGNVYLYIYTETKTYRTQLTEV